MIDKLISFDTAKLAKEKGFNSGCGHLHGEYEGYDGLHSIDNFNKINNEKQYSAPSQSLLQKWLREEYEIDISIARSMEIGKEHLFGGTVTNFKTKEEYLFIGRERDIWIAEHNHFENEKSYEEALEKALQEGLKFIK